MTEQQLREKLQFAYGTMPDATRAAFEHSLTHHRAPETHRSIGLSPAISIVKASTLPSYTASLTDTDSKSLSYRSSSAR